MQESQLSLIRKYLRRKIADKNKVIGGMTAKFDIEGAHLRKEILREFARGSKYVRAIEEDMKSHSSISMYNYFDLDTLIAYELYLDKVIKFADRNRRNRGKYYLSPRDLHDAIKVQVPKFFCEGEQTFETGFYNPNQPITPLLGEDGKVMYERTPDKKTFESKYNLFELEKNLALYMVEKERAINSSSIRVEDNEISATLPEENSDNKYNAILDKNTQRLDETIDDEFENMGREIEFKGEKYILTHEEHFFDSDHTPIKYVNGYGEVCKILGYLTYDNQEYVGDVYDDEENIVCTADQTGIDIYINGKPFKRNDNERDR